MHIILLSGGSGKRLWPLSNDVRSKQFIKIFKSPNGLEESMVQRITRGIKTQIPGATITIATGKTQVSALMNQLGDDVNICVEPCRRDTFPAIALAASFLKDKLKAGDDEAVVVCPVDPYVEDDYFRALRTIAEETDKNPEGLTLMGIEPTYPSEKYGYILANADDTVNSFKEKPDLETAKELLKQKALWNGGVFGFKLKYLLDKTKAVIGYCDFESLHNNYENLTKISFDYAVVEKESKIRVSRFAGQWKDLGTWNTLTEAMTETVVGNAVLDDTSENTHIVNELDLPILGMGLKNIVVAASADGILVADKHESSYMKPYVDKLEGPVMYAEKSWGSYKVLDVEKGSLTIKVTLLPNHEMNYHSHERRTEVWTCLEGEGEVTLNGITTPLKPGDVVHINIGDKHKVKANTRLVLSEVQIGKDIDVKDKIKY